MKNEFIKTKVIKTLRIIGIVFVLLLLIVFLFLKLWYPLGGNPSKIDKEVYASRASNYKDGEFFNENKKPVVDENYKEHDFISQKEGKPVDKIPIEIPVILNNPSLDMLNVTWLGHSTILFQMHEMNILIDPIFNDTASPVSFIGPKRFSELPLEIEDLPNIDIVIITHDHYDHLDYKTIKKIDDKVNRYLVPLGIENHLERWKVDENKINTFAWWDEIEINDLLIACTPSRHNSGRSLNNRNSTLWSSWVLADKYHKVFVSGDTGYDNHFRKIGNKYGEFDLALFDSGQYDARWKESHMTPEEAVNAGVALNSKIIMPIHWGAFKLASHPWDDSVERFIAKAKQEKIKYITPKIGETIIYQEDINTSKWWNDIG